MLKYTKIQNKPRIFQSFTGLSLEEFEELLPMFEKAYDKYLDREDSRRKTPRQRCRGGGRKSSIEAIEDKLLFILFYFKMYPIQEVLGFLFGMSQAQANIWIHRLTPVLNAALGYKKELPARKPCDMQRVLAECPGLEFIIDATERPIQRPKDKDRKKTHYSGKKKRHMVKNTVVNEKRTKKIKVLGKTQPGSKHDKQMAEEDDIPFPPKSKVRKDNGYQGYEPAHTTTYQSKKKPRGKELSEAEKEQNRQLSKERIAIEHSIGGVKIYHIVRDIFRNHKTDFEDLVMETACGLFNLRIQYRHIQKQAPALAA